MPVINDAEFMRPWKTAAKFMQKCSFKLYSQCKVAATVATSNTAMQLRQQQPCKAILDISQEGLNRMG